MRRSGVEGSDYVDWMTVCRKNDWLNGGSAACANERTHSMASHWWRSSKWADGRTFSMRPTKPINLQVKSWLQICICILTWAKDLLDLWRPPKMTVAHLHEHRRCHVLVIRNSSRDCAFWWHPRALEFTWIPFWIASIRDRFNLTNSQIKAISLSEIVWFQPTTKCANNECP